MGITGYNGEIPKLSILPKFPNLPIIPIFPKLPIIPIFPILPTIPTIPGVGESRLYPSYSIVHPVGQPSAATNKKHSTASKIEMVTSLDDSCEVASLLSEQTNFAISDHSKAPNFSPLIYINIGIADSFIKNHNILKNF